MATALDLIKSSLRQIGAIAAGEAPSASETSDSLDALNDILEEWSNEGLLIYEKKIEEFTFVAGTNSYTIGSGATFDTARPLTILAAKSKRAGQSDEWPLKVLTTEEWAAIAHKAVQAETPEALYYNQTYPNGTLYVWPTPSAANKLVLYSLKPLTAIASSATSLSFPPGYKKALKHALAVELALEFGRPVDAKLEDLAVKSKAGLMRANYEPALLTADAFGMNEETPHDWRLFD